MLKLLAGPLRLTPKQDKDGTRYYEFEGEGTFAKMLVDFAHPITVASTTRTDRRGKVKGDSRPKAA